MNAMLQGRGQGDIDDEARAGDGGPPPLVADGLLKVYEGRHVLDRLTLTLAPGTVLGLIGRNGAGKSTLIRALLGLIQPDAGEARVWGRSALALDDASKARLGYVPQQPEALAWLKVGDMLDFVGRFYPRWDHDFVNTTLERWQLPRNRLLAKLSPGERQRVAIVRALAMRPELLVLDEPAAALDPVARRDLLREIATRAGEFGTTVLFSTHIVSDLERVASHVAFMHEGRVLLHSELDGLKERHMRLHVPRHAADQLVGRVPGEVARRQHPYGGISVVLVREEGAPWPSLVHAPGVQRESLSLEDLFVEVAG
ncbi:ABC transporter ATP-binding protein [Aerolutibacter ruishenii]|uniref:ABC-2 type transport system ATP-binding protein n=1 Tax=Aerolutibacter ruishenii TaxID=686800 RepID=A0A562M0V1_9GAMM|nr:ABC transporter ATP-binding protein [Lysobacter ruishenii]TWI13408.1 ABC-2 type transport system ATP-binding protein [Lysobacter ruishenii]